MKRKAAVRRPPAAIYINNCTNGDCKCNHQHVYYEDERRVSREIIGSEYVFASVVAYRDLPSMFVCRAHLLARTDRVVGHMRRGRSPASPGVLAFPRL